MNRTAQLMLLLTVAMATPAVADDAKDDLAGRAFNLLIGEDQRAKPRAPQDAAEAEAKPDAAGPDAKPAAAEPEGPAKLTIVRTWGELLGQPPVKFGRDGVVRLGVESDRIHSAGGLLVYALVDGDRWEPQPVDALGPLRVRVTPLDPDRVHQNLGEIQMQMQQPEGAWRGAKRMLFVASIADAGGPVRVEVLDGNRAIARTELTVDAAVIHPWFPFAETEDARFNQQLSGEEAVETTLTPDLSRTAVPRIDGSTPVRWEPADAPIAPESPLPRFVLEPDRTTAQLTATRRRKDWRLDLKLPEAMTIGDVRGSVLVRWWVNGQPMRPPEQAELERMFDRGMQLRQGDAVRIVLEVPEQTFGEFGGERIGLQLLWCPDGWDRPNDAMGRFNQVRRLQMRMNQPNAAASPMPIMSNRVEITMPFRVGLHDSDDYDTHLALAAAARPADPRDGVE